ncbi:MAG TPA: alpha/beta hydrolase [Acidimicrobiales bacterium]|nr:alpha/beta hydrolase [Acidimicrobiales bacterium]
MLRALAGGALFGEVWGPSPPELLVLHGWGRSHGDFSAVVGPTAPAGPLAAWAPDLPGFGSSPAPPSAWGSAEYAAALVPLLEEAPGPARPVVVLGHSLGGRLAVTLAATRPDLVRALVLTGAPVGPRTGGGRRPPAGYRLARALHRRGLLSEARMEAGRQRHGSADYRAAEGVMRDVLVRLVNERYDDALAAIGCPVELVWGDDDAEVPVEVARRLLSVLPDATLTLCPGAGHLTPLTASDELRSAAERALARS